MVLAERRQRLTRRALEELLLRLAPEPEAAGREYETLRQRLSNFFDRRGILSADALADETLDRVARRLEAGEAIERVRPYCHGVARHVYMEWRKEHVRESAALTEAARVAADGRTEGAEEASRCLDRCLAELPADSQHLIVAYYQGLGSAHIPERKLLAERLGITYVALKTRAHRIRTDLAVCLRRCLEASAVTEPPPESHSNEAGR
jgi:DNA-directed RNA polymerase specialized sigma24 family protein